MTVFTEETPVDPEVRAISFLALFTEYAYACWIVFPFAVPLIMRVARRHRTDK